MPRAKLLVFAASCATIAGAMSFSIHIVQGQSQSWQPSPQLPPYDPYPPGILPSDIRSEEKRIEREITGIENEAIGEWKALPPVTPVGNPPIFQGSGYQAVEVLGKLLNFDLNMSPLKDTACASCHMPYAGFSGPIPSVNLTMIAYPGKLSLPGPTSGQRHDTPIHPISLYLSTTLNRACSLAETSGMDARLDTCCRVLTPSRHSFRRSIRGR